MLIEVSVCVCAAVGGSVSASVLCGERLPVVKGRSGCFDCGWHSYSRRLRGFFLCM